MTSKLKATKVEKIWEDGVPAGAYTFNEAQGMIVFVCPCGCGQMRSVPVAGQRGWTWNGDKNNPTITPSIQVVGECGFHGFLTNGEWIIL